jgi:Protein of unknown function (DUF2585)
VAHVDLRHDQAGAPRGAELGNAQHLFDWYSFTLPRWPVTSRLVPAIALEAGWEILEKHEFRDRPVSLRRRLGCHGDSTVNSNGDLGTMIVGFGLARVVPVWASAAAVIVIEIRLIYLIRDNLFLNVVMLMYPRQHPSQARRRSSVRAATRAYEF